MKSPEIDIDDPAVFEFLNSLSEDERAALNMKRYGYNKTEIAKALGKSNSLINRTFDKIEEAIYRWWPHLKRKQKDK